MCLLLYDLRDLPANIQLKYFKSCTYVVNKTNNIISLTMIIIRYTRSINKLHSAYIIPIINIKFNNVLECSFIYLQNRL